jgi:polyisoprenoid-binding protein YceI
MEVTSLAWQIDKAHTQASFSIRHLGISFISGHVNVGEADLQLDEANPGNSKLSVKMDMNTFTTHDPNRDGHLKSPDLLDVAQYPNVEFATKRVQDQGNGKFDVVGDLTIKGVTREVALQGEYEGPVVEPFGGKRKMGFHLSGEIDKTDFGVNWNVPFEGGLMLNNRIRLNIDAQAIEA